MLRGIWKSIGKSQRYLSVYHAVPVKTVVSQGDLCVFMVEDASKLMSRESPLVVENTQSLLERENVEGKRKIGAEKG